MKDINPKLVVDLIQPQINKSRRFHLPKIGLPRINLRFVKTSTFKKIVFFSCMIIFFIICFVVAKFIVKTVFTPPNSIKINSEKKSEPENDSKIKFSNDEFKLPSSLNSGGLNLIFLADQYPSWEEFEQDINALMLEMAKIDPWRMYNQFNLFKIKPKSDELCNIITENQRKPTLRCNNDINDYLNVLSLQRFKLIVLSRQDFQSWANVVRLENSGIFFSASKSVSGQDQKGYGLLFAHLFGHAFGLKDEEEFVLAQAGGAPHTPDGPNCAPNKASAEKWWGNLTKMFKDVGYFKGCCGSSEYIKPTQASIMNLNTGADLVYDYGPVSKIYLAKILDYCFSNKIHTKEEDLDFFAQYPDFVECVE